MEANRFAARWRGGSIARALSGLLLALAAGMSAASAPPPASPQAKPQRPLARVMPALRGATLRSHAALVMDAQTGQTLFAKRPHASMPIASITKLMTALVVIEARQNMAQILTVSSADVDRLKYSSSRLRIGTKLRRDQMLKIALMSSENRAASALARHYPGGTPAFVAAMNAKAAALGMRHTRYVDPTGLSSANVSTPAELATLVMAARKSPTIARYSTTHAYSIRQGKRATRYRNSNRLVGNAGWDIRLQKTGYIAEAGRCLVMHAKIAGRGVVMVFLDAQGRLSRGADATRVRKWLEKRARSRTKARARR